MKTIITLLLASVTLTNANAQFYENFDQNVSNLSSNCWTVNQVNHTTQSGDVINGTGSATTNPPTSSSGERTIATPYLNVTSSSLSISFLYKTSNNINGNAIRTIEVGIINTQNVFTSLQVITLDRNTPTTVLTHNATYAISSAGTYKVQLKISGSADGNSRVIFDDLNVGASARYGPSNHCNPAGIAVNDTYSSAGVTSYSGNVLSNDQLPADNETYTPSVVVAPTTGTLVLSADGSFTYTPAASFTGGAVTFTYLLTDNGYPATTSNIATVTINYPVIQLLPMKLINFSADLKAQSVNIKWIVENAHEGNYYEIEKSLDGVVFEVLKKIAANLHSTEYAIADNKFNGSAYYRLKLYNTDLSTSYSRIIQVNTSKPSVGLNVLGNPVSSVLKFRLMLSGNQTASAKIYTISGVKLSEVALTEAGNMNEYSLNVQNLPAGTYAINVSSQGSNQTVKFIKK